VNLQIKVLHYLKRLDQNLPLAFTGSVAGQAFLQTILLILPTLVLAKQRWEGWLDVFAKARENIGIARAEKFTVN
jgi:hypothetical protein